ncbi:hypothetical protein ACFCX4_26655 [Kitasatospora sp. NPDC056327]|uniref:hypothetical protein n=1 Tax=Kitasatospora sp. NPDC056327 TaxID=3345785 RepID=UPI0035D95F7F
MRTRFAALTLAAAGITATTIVPAAATTTSVAAATTATTTTTAAGSTGAADSGGGAVACTAVLNQPCVWRERDGAGIVGIAQVSAEPGRLTIVRVEVRTQRAWGGPWVTAASATTLTTGSARAVTPRVVTEDLRMVCATAGPALEAAQQVTTCTGPF